MDLQKILADLKDCPCGRAHTIATRMVEIESGLLARAGEYLLRADFPRNILLVSDRPAMNAAQGLTDVLRAAGFTVTEHVWEKMIYARIEQVREVEALLEGKDGVLAVGTGSVNDICRVASYRKGKQFAIFATAPSMDGFASDSAPIIENNFKTSIPCEQPAVILADTKILAAAPAELKAAGFGDMVAKYIGIVDWQVARLVIDEYYCPSIAKITMRGTTRVMEQYAAIQRNDEAAVSSIMEGLILTGLAMKLAGCSRPASGAEHVVSHYWECHKLTNNVWPGYHGDKVGVASLLLLRAYRNIANRVLTVDPVADPTDWSAVYAAYDKSLRADVARLNSPTITDLVDPARLKACWPQIREIIQTVLPDPTEMERMMRIAGCAITPADVHVDKELLENGLRYHPYMRYRMLLTRIMPMLGIDIMDYLE